MAIVGFLVKHNFLLTVVLDPKKTYEVKKAPSNTTTVTTHSLPLTGNKSWFEKKAMYGKWELGTFSTK